MDTTNTNVDEKSSSRDMQASQASGMRRLPIMALFVANTISSVGNVLTFLAIPWFVLQITRSYALMGLTAFMSASSAIISTFFGSLFVDRLGYKRASVVSDVASCLGVLLIPLCYQVFGLAFWTLLVLVFLSGLPKAPGGVARDSMVPDLAALAQMSLERTNAMIDSARRISSFIGAPLAGFLIVLLGTSNLLWCDAVSFFISALLIALTVPTFALHERHKSKEQQGTYLSRLGEDLRFLGKQQVILTLVFTVMVTELLDAADSTVITPVYVKQVFGNPIVLGLLWGIFGGMAFLGTIIFGAIGHRLPRQLTFGLCFMLVGLRFWSMAFYLPLWMLIGVFALAGLAVGPLNPLILTAQQRLIPAEMRARILSIVSAGYMAGTPLGGLLGGGLITWLGLTSSLFVIAVGYLLATSSLLVNPKLRSLDRR